ncbi:hypothetical protein SAMN05444266_107205 [Chitinophaga jiangningensis]|uniref:Uncharacterized protein n=1 Tax=Chitinophaga jiangningensis TaxID=1419482 RepID=A0A1M7HEF4_9BACT|nr:hypothetical protein SAMN05444266_107205 [Chitinophaga jiangningensis]
MKDSAIDLSSVSKSGKTLHSYLREFKNFGTNGKRMLREFKEFEKFSKRFILNKM